jgi:hypothetical protein
MTNYAPTFPRNIWTVPKGKIAIHNYIEHHVGRTSGEEDHRTPPDPGTRTADGPFCAWIHEALT